MMFTAREIQIFLLGIGFGIGWREPRGMCTMKLTEGRKPRRRTGVDTQMRD